MISVIVPTRHSDILEYTIKSLKEQTSKDFEVIVVEYENYSEKTETICTGFAQFHTSKTLNNAKNVGIHYSSGDRIVFLEESIVSPDWIENIYKCKDECFYGPVLLKTDKPRPWWFHDPISKLLGERKIEEPILNDSNNVVISKNLINKIGGFNSDIETNYYFSNSILEYQNNYNKSIVINRIIPDQYLSPEYINKTSYIQGYIDFMVSGKIFSNHENYWIKYAKKFEKREKKWLTVILNLFKSYRNGAMDCALKSECKYTNNVNVQINDILNVYNSSEEYALIKVQEPPTVKYNEFSYNKALCVIATDEISKAELDITRDSHKLYCEKYNLDYVEILDDLDLNHKCSHKYILSDIAKKYDQTLYIDCDVLITKKAENIFNETESWGLFNETDLLPINIYNSLVNEIKATAFCNRVNVEVNNWYNCGVMVVPRDCYKTYFPPKNPSPNVWCLEQHWFNIMKTLNKCNIKNLDIKWNCGWTFNNFPDLLKKAYFIHINGCPHPLRLDFLRHFATGSLTIPYKLIEKVNELKWKPEWI